MRLLEKILILSHAGSRTKGAWELCWFSSSPPRTSQWGTFSRRGTGEEEGERRHENYVPEKPVTHTNITQSEGKGGGLGRT